MTVGQTHQLGKIVGPSDAKVHWNVANDNIATIDQTGKITALAPGSTAVWIEVSKFEVTETATFTLTVESGVTINNLPSNKSMKIGQTHVVSASVSPSTLDQSVKWSSSKQDVAKIDENTGLITALKPGTTVIRATSVFSSKNYGEFTLRVQKRAIILMSGMMGSELYTDQEGITYQGTNDIGNPVTKSIPINTKVWEPAIDTLYLYGRALIDVLECYPNGESKYKLRTPLPIITPMGTNINNPSNNPNKFYGALNTFKNIYQKLYDNFRSQSDIVIYQYDWREDPYDTALKFDTFVKSQSYDDIILIGFSMGGLVSSQYMALGADRRDKITKYISVNVPYLGAPLAARIYNDGDFYEGHSFKDKVIELIVNSTLNEAIKDVAPNIKTLYALMPPEQKFNNYLISDSGLIYGYNNTMQFFSQNLSNWNETLVAEVRANQARMFINGTHVTRLLDDVYYIVGTGESTTTSLQAKYSSESFSKLESIKTDNGDGTVPLWSATIGNTINSYNKTFFKVPREGMTALHSPMIEAKDGDYSTINFIIEIIKGNINGSTNANTIYQYGFIKNLA